MVILEFFVLKSCYVKMKKLIQFARTWPKNMTKTSLTELCQEMQDLKFLLQKSTSETAPELLDFIDKYGKEIANFCVALRLLLTGDISCFLLKVV